MSRTCDISPAISLTKQEGFWKRHSGHRENYFKPDFIDTLKVIDAHVDYQESYVASQKEIQKVSSKFLELIKIQVFETEVFNPFWHPLAAPRCGSLN